MLHRGLAALYRLVVISILDTEQVQQLYDSEVYLTYRPIRQRRSHSLLLRLEVLAQT